MNRTDYARAVLLGVVIGISFLTLFHMVFNTALDVQEPVEPKPDSQRFEVVDTYKGCDLVRWENHMLADYKYFLHCNNTHPVYEK